jgi:trigger factor
MIEYQSSIDDVDEVTKSVKVSFGAPLVDERLNSRLGTIQKTAKLKGFRPGKAPLSLVRRLHADSERFRILERLIGESLEKVIEENEFKVVGRPEISIDSQGLDGADIEYRARVWLYPSPQIVFEDELKVSIPFVGDIEEALTDTLRNLQKAQGKPVAIGDRQEVREGDVVSIVFGAADSEGDGTKQPHKFVVGEKEVPEALDQAVLGKKVGESFEVELPSQGEDARKFCIEVTEIYQLELPELDDEFAKNTSYQVETIEDLKGKIREALEAQLKEVRNNAIDGEIVKSLAERHRFALPEIMVQNEIKAMFKVNGDDADDKFKSLWTSFPQEQQSEVWATAESRVRAAIILEQYAEVHQVDVAQEEEDGELVKLLGQGGEGLLNQIPANSPIRVMVRERVRNAKSLASIREKAIVEEKQLSEETDS